MYDMTVAEAQIWSGTKWINKGVLGLEKSTKHKILFGNTLTKTTNDFFQNSVDFSNQGK